MAINEQIPLSAGPAGAARIDQSIPMNVDSRLPLSVKPFQPIDTMAAAGDAYKLADTIENFKSDQSDRIEKQQLQEEKKRDKMILQQYQQSGGDLYTAGGLELAAKELGTRLSPDSLEGLAKRIDAKKNQEIKLQTSLVALDDSALDVVAKQKETASKMMNGALSAYDYALSQTKDPEKAKQAYVATKQAMIQAAANEKSPITGRPAYPPEQLNQFETLEPEQLRSIVNDTKWHMDKVKEEQVNRLREAQTKSAEATTGYKEKETEAIDTKLAQAQEKIDMMAKKVKDAAGKPLDPKDVATMAEQVRVFGPQVLSRLGLSKEQRQSVISGVTALNEGEGVSAREGAIEVGTLKADQKSLDKLVPQLDAVDSFEKTASQIGDKLVAIAKKVDSTGVPVLERWIRAGRKSVKGDPDVTEFNSRLNTYTSESAKILNNPNLTGPTTDSARHEMQEVMPNASYFEQIERGVNVMKEESGWRKKNLKDKIDEVNQRRIRGAKKESSEGFPSVSKSQQGEMDQGRTEILTQELDSAQARRDEAQNPDAKRRAEQDIAAIERELAGTTGEKSTSKKSAPLKNAKGWALHQDAKGNRAYVGPNGEIEEVK
jgi:hypothetical protein